MAEIARGTLTFGASQYDLQPLFNQQHSRPSTIVRAEVIHEAAARVLVNRQWRLTTPSDVSGDSYCVTVEAGDAEAAVDLLQAVAEAVGSEYMLLTPTISTWAVEQTAVTDAYGPAITAFLA